MTSATISASHSPVKKLAQASDPLTAHVSYDWELGEDQYGSLRKQWKSLIVLKKGELILATTVEKGRISTDYALGDWERHEDDEENEFDWKPGPDIEAADLLN